MLAAILDVKKYWNVSWKLEGGCGGIALPSVGGWMQLEMQLHYGGKVSYKVVYDCV